MGWNREKHNQEFRFGASGVGAGGTVGLVIVAITKNLPDTSLWKDVLLFAVPYISAVVGLFFALFIEWLSHKLNMTKLSGYIKNMNRLVEKAKENNLTEEQLEKIEEKRKESVAARVFSAMDGLDGENKGKEE